MTVFETSTAPVLVPSRRPAFQRRSGLIICLSPRTAHLQVCSFPSYAAIPATDLHYSTGVSGPNAGARAQSHAIASSTLHQQYTSPSKSSFSPFSRTTRSSSPSYTMGQVQSEVRGPSPSPSPQVESQPSSSMGQKLRLAWPVRRRKTLEPASALASPVSVQPKLKDQFPSPPSVSPQPSLSSSPSSSAHSHDDQGRVKNRTSAKQMASQFASNALMAMKGKRNASTTSVSMPASPALEAQNPPPLPPKPMASRLSTSSQRSASTEAREHSEAEERTEISDHPTLITPEKELITEVRSEVQHTEHNATSSSQLPVDMEVTESGKVDNTTPTGEMSRAQSIRKRERKGDEEKANADDWRKSDSTLRTVRLVGPGGMPVGARTPRPLSLAESTNSGSTVQATNIIGANAGKRLSALIMDADFGMPEVDSEDDDDEVLVPRNFGIDLGRKSSDVQPPAQSETTPTGAVTPSTNRLRRQSGSPSPQSSPCPSPAPGKISKLVKAARRGSNSITGRFSPSPRRGDGTRENPYPDSDHDAAVSGSDSEALSSNSLDCVPSASSSTTSVTSSPSQNSKDTGSLASSAFDQYSYSSAETPGYYQSRVDKAPELHPWVTSSNASESSTSLSASTTSSSSHGNAHIPTGKVPSLSKENSLTSMEATQRSDAPRSRAPSTQPPRGLRQTAVSLTSASAGFAKGFGKRAVDKLGKALSGSSTNVSSAGSGGESSVPSSFHFGADRSGHSSSRSASGTHHKSVYGSSGSDSQHGDVQRQKKRHGLKKGRTPNAPSGTWSVASSDSEAVSNHPGMNMGYVVRRPLRPGQGGLVFGRNLADCVRETAVRPGTIGVMPIGKDQKRASRMSLGEAEAARNRILEERHIPALVARCAQHIEKWGIQEEGLFRYVVFIPQPMMCHAQICFRFL